MSPPTLLGYEPSPKLRVSLRPLHIKYLYLSTDCGKWMKRRTRNYFKMLPWIFRELIRAGVRLYVWVCICLSIRKTVLPHSILHISRTYFSFSGSINISRCTWGNFESNQKYRKIYEKKNFIFDLGLCYWWHYDSAIATRLYTHQCMCVFVLRGSNNRLRWFLNMMNSRVKKISSARK